MILFSCLDVIDQNHSSPPTSFTEMHLGDGLMIFANEYMKLVYESIMKGIYLFNKILFENYLLDGKRELSSLRGKELTDRSVLYKYFSEHPFFWGRFAEMRQTLISWRSSVEAKYQLSEFQQTMYMKAFSGIYSPNKKYTSLTEIFSI